MSDRATTKPSLRHKAVEEFREMLALTAYLYVCLGSIMLLEKCDLAGSGYQLRSVGHRHRQGPGARQVHAAGPGGEARETYRHQPLIWPTLHMALMFLLLLLVLTTLEEVLVGLIHGRTLAASLAHVVGPNFFVGFATCFVMFLVLVPYCAFKTLGGVIGDDYLIRMFFVERIDKRQDGGTN